MNPSSTIFWFRQDLRLADNPGLFEAVKNGSVLPIYIFDDNDPFKMGAASQWWLHYSLKSLNQSLDGQLNFYVGNALEVISKLIHKQKIQAVYWNRCYEPQRIEQDNSIEHQLKQDNIACEIFQSSLLWEPKEVLKSDGKPYKVFTPFYRHALSTPFSRDLFPAPKKVTFAKDPNNITTLDALKLLPCHPWQHSLEEACDVGEQAAQKKLHQFLKDGLLGYQKNRDYPARPNLSRLSPHLHFGEISPHQIWHALEAKGINKLKKDADYFLRELTWREFSYSLLIHFPELPWKNFQPKFDRFPWKKNQTFLTAWQHGKTGYPIVDAGMRELWQTGTMHNRVRMITASFLVKNLLIHWHEGAAWFWDCLVDADLANNSVNWQWVAGSGVDAAPYFRIFNPVLQGEKFDPQGEYTCHFVPELKAMPKKFLFKPWEASETILENAGVTLGKNYPHPIVNLQESRDRALDAYHELNPNIS